MIGYCTNSITRFFRSLRLGRERKTNSRSSSGKFSHSALPEPNHCHPFQFFKIETKHTAVCSLFPTVSSFSLMRLYTSRKMWVWKLQKFKLSAAHSEDHGEISIHCTQAERDGWRPLLFRLANIFAWNKPSQYPNFSETLPNKRDKEAKSTVKGPDQGIRKTEHRFFLQFGDLFCVRPKACVQKKSNFIHC